MKQRSPARLKRPLPTARARLEAFGGAVFNGCLDEDNPKKPSRPDGFVLASGGPPLDSIGIHTKQTFVVLVISYRRYLRLLFEKINAMLKLKVDRGEGFR